MHSVVCFCYFWKHKPLLVLTLFISEYLDQIPPWKEMKETFSVKLQSENLCFCLISGCPNKEYNAIFIHINQNIRAYPGSEKKLEFIKDSQNIFEYSKESEQSEALVNKLGLFQIQLRGLGGSTTPANKIAI